MLKNYLKSTIRSLFRRRAYSLVNIMGFSLGLMASFLVILYTRYELTYDSFHTDSERIVRISGKNQDTWFAALFSTYSNAIYNHSFPEVEMMARIRRYPPKYIHYQEARFYEDKVLFTDPGTDFFKLFNFRFLKGNAANALRQENNAVITSSFAAKLFGNEDPIGRSILYDSINLVISAVIEDLPGNTNLNFTMLIPNTKAMEEASGLFSFCKLSKNTDIGLLKKKILALPKPSNQFRTLSDLAIIPLKELHFTTGMTFEMKPPASKTYLLLFNIIGIVIVILSCANYMSLAVALYAERKKEIAVRKVMGATNFSLSLQFFIDAFCMAVFSLPVTLALLSLILPVFNRFMNVQLHNTLITSPGGIALLCGITLLVSIIAGSYPAWVLPKLKAVSLFKKQSIFSRQGINLRKVFITFQVTILIVILSTSWVIYNQLRYIREKDLGFNKEGVIKLSGASMTDSAQYYTLKNELLQNPHILDVSRGLVPGDENFSFTFHAPGSDLVYNDLISINTDYDYLASLNLKLLQAGFAGKDRPARALLINETLARRLGYQNPIGKTIALQTGKKEKLYTIDGVVNDFNFFSLHQPVAPMLMSISAFRGGIDENILVKVQPGDLTKTLDFIKEKTDAIIPDIPLTVKFLDDSLDQLYDKEQRLSVLSQALLLVTLFLSVIGLIGLSAYMAALRNKEIGIRKVTGASVSAIVLLLSKDFLRLVTIAFIIACPVSWYFIKQWLQGFAYGIHTSWWIFLFAGGIALLVVLLTISYQSIRAAIVNPVKSLRTE